MNKMSFDFLGYTWERVTRSEARTRYDRGEDLMLCPSKLRPGYPWHPEVYVYYSAEEPQTFDQMDNAFRYYNLSPEAGRGVLYFKNASRERARK